MGFVLGLLLGAVGALLYAPKPGDNMREELQLRADELKKRAGGLRSTSVTVPAGTTLCFRYLGEGMAWFDDADAPPCEHGGSVSV